MSQKSFSPAAGFPHFPGAPGAARHCRGRFFRAAANSNTDYPAALAGSDILGLAQTGTGKTAAFALPIIEHLLSARRPGPRALILAPTRELAMQIHSDFEKLAKFTRLKAVTVFGGVSERPQVRALRNQRISSLPALGRLLDLLRQGKAMLGQIKILVLDEADQMFDMGFLPDIRRILSGAAGEAPEPFVRGHDARRNPRPGQSAPRPPPCRRTGALHPGFHDRTRPLSHRGGSEDRLTQAHAG